MKRSEYEKKTKSLIKTFNGLSFSYKNKFTSSSEEKAKVQSLVNLFGIKKGSKLLEVGGGTGDLSPFLLKKLGRDGELVFLDISPGMVGKARAKLHRYKNIKYICADVTYLRVPGTFNNIVVFNAFPHFLNKKRALSNIFKLLQPEGRLIISHNNSRWNIVGHHKRKEINAGLSDFPEDGVVFDLLADAGFSVEVFENNEGYDYYLVVAKRNI